MAVVPRCLHSPSQPDSGVIFRRLHRHQVKSASGTHATEEIGFFPLSKERREIFSLRVQASSQKGRSLLRNFIMSKEALLQLVRSEKLNGKLSEFCHIVIQCTFNHEGMVSINFPKTFVLAYLIMFILPPEVLAETCEADNTFYKMPLLFAIALIGAAVGGVLARLRRGELEHLNDQLRQINAALRRQAKIESYAPSLSYAPVGRTLEKEVIVDPKKQELISRLRSGENFLRNRDLDKAFMEFKAALELAQSLGDHIEEKKAARGLGATLQRQGKYREAIKFHLRILDICEQIGEDSGSTEAYGAIADCHTELGDLERAAKFYDKYIATLKTD